MTNEFGNYDEMYGGLDYTGAAVLDLGADYGSTAKWFLSRGAAKVFASERNPEWDKELRAFAKTEPRVTVWPKLTAENAEIFLRDLKPDIVKVDVERQEVLLLAAPDALLARPRAWVMETHTLPIHAAFCYLFRRLGYDVQLIKDWGELSVVQAVRK